LQRASDATSRAALSKLRRRGLTDERIAEGRLAFAQFRNAKPKPLPDLAARRAQIHAAERELWSYFVEWGQIARATIKDPRLLAKLGYGTGTADEEEPETSTVAERTSPPAKSVTKKKRPSAHAKKKVLE